MYFLITRTLTLFNVKRRRLFLGIATFIFTFPIFSVIDYLNRGIKFVEVCGTIGYIITAFLIYYVLTLLVILLVRFIIALIKKKHHDVYDKTTVILSTVFSIVICILGIVLAQVPEVSYYDFDIAGEHDLNVVVLSDIHYGSTGSLLSLDKMVDNINKQDADVVILAGDVFDNYIGNLSRDEFASAMNRINSKLGVYAITGNHEFKLNSLEQIIYFYEGTQVKLLLDEEVIVDNIRFVGRIDYKHGRKELSEVVSTSKLPLVVLDHQPQYFREAIDVDADLQISGHTHNGQIFPGDIIVYFYNLILFNSPSNGINHFADFTLAITRGYGTWGFPMRLSGASQIVIFNLK